MTIFIQTNNINKKFMITVSIQLPDDLFDRLQRLTDRSGLSSDFYLTEVLGQHIGELECQYAAEQPMPEARIQRTLTYTLDDVERELGLAG